MDEITKPQAGMVATNDFMGQSLAMSGETMATVLAARAKAEVEARYIVAMNRPRNWDIVRQRLLNACERPGFAGSATEKVWGAAWYLKPIGSGVEGFSIRFAEECIRCMGNLDARSQVIWESDTERLVQVDVVDLESNISIPTTIPIKKTVERKYMKKGQKAMSTRLNSYGDPVYLLEATEDEVMQKQNAAISKAIRNAVLRLVPGDIQAECRERILQIRSGDAARDPEGYKRKIIDSFALIGVKAADLRWYLDHDLDSCSPSELEALRDLYSEIKDGKTNWGEISRAIKAERAEKPEPEDNRTQIEILKDDIAAAKKAKE